MSPLKFSVTTRKVSTKYGLRSSFLGISSPELTRFLKNSRNAEFLTSSKVFYNPQELLLNPEIVPRSPYECDLEWEKWF